MQNAIEKFNPTKAELLTMADNYKNLTINGIEDVEGYKAVHEARMELKKTRVALEKYGKSAREQFLAAQKETIRQEKELVGIIEPLEKELKEKQDAIDLAKEMKKREKLLPERKKMLEEIECFSTDESLLLMDDAMFQKHYYDQKAVYLENKERKMKEEEDRKEAERLAEQERIAEKARLAEEERQRKIKEDEDRIAAEKEKVRLEREGVLIKKLATIGLSKKGNVFISIVHNDIKEYRSDVLTLNDEDFDKAFLEIEGDVISRNIAEENRIEQEEIDRKEKLEEAKREAAIKAKKEAEEEQARKEAAKKKAKEDQLAKEKAEQEALEKKKKYKEFLDSHGYNETDFKVFRDGDTITLYKKVGELKI